MTAEELKEIIKKVLREELDGIEKRLDKLEKPEKPNPSCYPKPQGGVNMRYGLPSW